MNKQMSLSPGGLIVRGILALILGFIAMTSPFATLLAFVFVWGFWALIEGIYMLVAAFQTESGASHRAYLIMVGILALLASFFAIFQPGKSAVTIAILIGFWLIARGAFDFFGAFAAKRSEPRWLLITFGVLSFITGLIFLFGPVISIAFLSVWVGAFAFAYGVMGVIGGIMLKVKS
ncbi:HdeD family acid-resistance protein [Ornithinimicrobium sp. INDO-MA30-4]|uniref:HdeD family acid-resistance protein n=1 Tax=Ornithinimicrobium sp. INDO-MA30-4 TaxID=2908651 RepID=UPI001F311B4F|nr:DUF308 domain-containing protein [Ornithinimicrobium sp. INDO-MA30-4]UJH69945.1 DUF308 domain-containing protein [Ornithinimicrobium sp. INDO-MA30-4]